MKRFLAIFLAAMLMTACSENGETVVEDITTTELVSEEVTTVTTEETTASATETEAEETTAETAIETTAETEAATTAEVSAETTAEAAAQNKSGTYAADEESLLGTWYVIDGENFGYGTMTFSEDGSVVSSIDTEEIICTYTVNNGLLELTYSDGNIQSFITVIDDGLLLMAIEGINTELIREEYVPYEEGQSIYDYFEPYVAYMSKEKPVLAEQKDILGKWIAKEYGEVVGTMLCEENSITITDGDYEETLPTVFKNGRETAVGDIPENVTLSEAVVYLCGGKLYMFGDDEFPIILERE